MYRQSSKGFKIFILTQCKTPTVFSVYQNISLNVISSPIDNSQLTCGHQELSRIKSVFLEFWFWNDMLCRCYKTMYLQVGLHHELKTCKLAWFVCNSTRIALVDNLTNQAAFFIVLSISQLESTRELNELEGEIYELTKMQPQLSLFLKKICMKLLHIYFYC